MIEPSKVANGVWGAANFKRYYHQILTLASQPDLLARRLIVGETFTPSGNWSTYPPHKHQVDDLPRRGNHPCGWWLAGSLKIKNGILYIVTANFQGSI
jgi:5-deoxy-glucuronate isomerase